MLTRAQRLLGDAQLADQARVLKCGRGDIRGHGKHLLINLLGTVRTAASADDEAEFGVDTDRNHDPAGRFLAQPHQKGLVERPVDYVKKNFWAGRTFRDFREIGPEGQRWLGRANERIHDTTQRRPVDLWTEERAQLIPLPAIPYDTDVVHTVPLQRWGHCVRFDTNDYSVPAVCLRRGRWITLRADDRDVRLFQGDVLVATHPRCWARHRHVIDPAHAQDLRPQRPAARFAQIETAFLTRYGEIGRVFYAGLGTKTERLEQHL